MYSAIKQPIASKYNCLSELKCISLWGATDTGSSYSWPLTGAGTIKPCLMWNKEHQPMLNVRWSSPLCAWCRYAPLPPIPMTNIVPSGRYPRDNFIHIPTASRRRRNHKRPWVVLLCALKAAQAQIGGISRTYKGINRGWDLHHHYISMTTIPPVSMVISRCG